MHRSRLVLSCVSALALAACSVDRPEAVAPASFARAASLSESPNGNYLLLSDNSGFGSDLAASVAALGGTLESVHDGAGIAVVSGLSSAAAAQLAGANGVAEVQADVVVDLSQPMAAIQADASAFDGTINSVANPAAAVRYSWQWNMRAIHADAAWKAGKLGDPSVTVAILDTGIDYNNPDLNGLVDLTRSKSFVASDNALTTLYFPTRNAITDYNGHGTNVAAQVSSKAVAHAGVTSRTTLIGVKVLAANGRGGGSAIFNGILWAADHGADVANMSLGGSFSKVASGQLVGYINRVLNYASKKGMLIVASAGNDEQDFDHNGNTFSTWCDAPHVLCVSAAGPTTSTGSPDEPAFYTNFGRSTISVAAPGGNAGATVTTWPWGMGNVSWVWSYCSKTYIAAFDTVSKTPLVLKPKSTPCAPGNRVTAYIGTSQAAPHVAGLAALLISVDDSFRGQPKNLKLAIEKSSDDLGQPGTDPYYGRGRINVKSALGL